MIEKYTSVLYEGGNLSLTRVIAATGWLAFLVASAYLMVVGETWGNYETFASIAAGGGAVTQIANKLINSKYNSPIGEPLVYKEEK